ncbi:MAG: type II secretion system F family protein [Methyloceanibacter sp.]
MFANPQTQRVLSDIVVAASVFGLLLATWVAGLLLWRIHRSLRLQKVKQRLRLMEQETVKPRTLRLWHEGREVATHVPGHPRRLSLVARLDRLCQEAGWSMPVHVLLPSLISASVLVWGITFILTRSAGIALGFSGAVIVTFWIYLRHRINQRLALFENQFAQAMGLAVRSLRAGHPLGGAFRLISEEMGAPVGGLFGSICQQQALGSSLEDAVRDVTDQYSSSDAKLFAASVVIHLRSGGNLADMMQRLASVIRERRRLSRRVRVLTAQTQLSKRVLIALPLVLFLAMNALNPQYVELLYTTSLGKTLLTIAAIGVVLGVWTMNRLVVIRY